MGRTTDARLRDLPPEDRATLAAYETDLRQAGSSCWPAAACAPAKRTICSFRTW